MRRTIELDAPRGQSLTSDRRLARLLRSLLASRLVAIGLAIILILAVVAALASWIAPYGPNVQSPYETLQGPSLAHPFGTDHLGRDILSRVIYGARISLSVGFIAIGIAMAIGVPLGLLSGFYRGWVDDVIMRFTDGVLAFPGLVLALGITAALGMGLVNVMIAIGLISWAGFARLVRGQVLSVREQDFVTAARSMGAGDARLMLQHIWPNVTAPVIVQMSLGVAFTIIAEASLSFLGIGVQPPTATWGSMLQEGSTYLMISPWLGIFPGLAIMVLVLAFNFVGDGLRDALDPRLRRR